MFGCRHLWRGQERNGQPKKSRAAPVLQDLGYEVNRFFARLCHVHVRIGPISDCTPQALEESRSNIGMQIKSSNNRDVILNLGPDAADELGVGGGMVSAEPRSMECDQEAF